MRTGRASGAGGAGYYAPDGPYAFRRMGLSLLISTVACVGMWAVIVVLPVSPREDGHDRRDDDKLFYGPHSIGAPARDHANRIIRERDY